jgi:hypothetical protein
VLILSLLTEHKETRMRLYTNRTTDINEATATPFRLKGGSGSALFVNGATGTATVTLLVNNVESGTVFQPVRDAYGTQVGVFAAVLGCMVIDPNIALWGKVIISGSNGSTNLTIDYGLPTANMGTGT